MGMVWSWHARIRLFSKIYDRDYHAFSSLQVLKPQPVTLLTDAEDIKNYEESRTCVEDLALYLKPLSNTRGLSSFSHNIQITTS